MPDATRRFFGALLMGVGVTMMTVCGACSALCLVVVLPAAFSWISQLATGRSPGGDDLGPVFVQTFALFGVVPVLVGWGAFWFGRRLRGDRPTSKPKPIWTPPTSGPDAS